MSRTTRRSNKAQAAKGNGNGSVNPHAALVPPHPPKQSSVDERLVGYQFPSHKDNTPIDFRRDITTGKVVSRGGKMVQSPWGIIMHDISVGIKDVVLPPLFIWKNGRWLNDFEDLDMPLVNVNVHGWDNPESNIWIVHGEGTPGAYAFRAYFIAAEYADDVTPKHPMMWKPEYKNKPCSQFQGTIDQRWRSNPTFPKQAYEDSWDLLEYGFLTALGFLITDDEKDKARAAPSSGWQTPGWAKGPSTPPANKPVTPAVTTAPALPFGIKFRCPKCGHWFEDNKLKAHSQVCPGQDASGYTDWIVMCDKDCGCEQVFGQPLGDKSLNHPSRCLPGFPRPTTKVEGGEELTTVEQEPEPSEETETPAEETPAETPEAEPAEGGDESPTTEEA